MKTKDLFTVLKWGMFKRIGLMFIAPYNPRETVKIKRAVKIAREDNDEVDKFIKAYIKQNESIL